MSEPSPSAVKGPLCAALAALVLSAVLGALGLFATIDRGIYDLLLSAKIRYFPLALNSQIIHADLSDSSEVRLGESLGSRGAFADFLNVLGSYNARVAFDFIFRTPAAEDAAFAEAARSASLCIMAIAPVEMEYANFAYDSLTSEEKALLSSNVWHIREHGKNNIPRARTFILSDYPISSAAAELAHIGVLPDSDGVYRRTPLFYRWEDGLIPAISLAVAVRELGIDPSAIEFYPGHCLVLPLSGDEAIRIPVDESCSALIPFTATWADDDYRISFERIAGAAHDEELYTSLFSELSGSMIMAADTTTGKRDFGITPGETVYPLSGIHTAVLSGIMEEYFYAPWSFAAKLGTLAVFLIALLFLSFIKKDARYNIAFLALLGGFTLWTVLAWFLLRLCPWYGAIGSGLFLFWISGFVLRLFRRYKEQILYQNALSRYFPRSLAARIASEKKIDLAPAYKELTILFSDIASFTAWSRDKEPSLVHAFLSEYLEAMGSIIFEYGGTVDKFMGDGILAFFGDPFDMPDHTRRCVDAAISMQKKIREMALTWKDRANIDLKVRMGINTGHVIVGNLGIKNRIEYTVIGADVNLGQRMEGAAPAGGILVTSAVREKTQDMFSFGERREVRVKGYEKPIEAYEVVFL
ncbi:adenylate/guanylate cyclase domain-containing protein [Leadbettera azotonutricia]|uniref:Putative adenylate/guanylate cyclase n=1 Tax=Leadbettera azotonutricia (strain ATCC BAA-888 / DSM 13862 / ZAS-9) TaxID=545695 RepID=F5YCS8_LEAAZ|nr:adenylate/guanylate cyclase domain-containing protein [Leadbettera azotonutricia]AEF81022.1 putative adenylate/guanylate cyclase [Leadbettera azotonutricia ZAS-9]